MAQSHDFAQNLFFRLSPLLVKLWVLCSQVSLFNIRVSLSVPSDSIGDRVQGEYPGWGPEGAAAQHGLQPERPLPPALLRYTAGAGV